MDAIAAVEGTGRWHWMRSELDALEEAGRLRKLEPAAWLEHGWIERGGKRLLHLASNHYLGFEPWLDDDGWAGLAAECRRLGEPAVRLGAGASRLITGHDPQHDALERELAAFKDTEAALVFSSGYMANAGVIPALVGRSGAVFSDRLNHASITDGIILSRARHIRYPHRDMDRLEKALKQWHAGGPGVPSRRARLLIVTDAVFSMDGTVAPLADLVTLKERYGAMLMVDEAHSGGVYGPGGRGLCHALGLHQKVDIMMGTFGKAFGAVGAYIAAEDIVVRYLVNRARTLIYNTGLPPLAAAFIRQRLRDVCAADSARAELMRKAALFRARLQAGGLDTGPGDSHIVPVLCGTDQSAVSLSAALAEAGVAGVAIRPPTVPEGTARIRFAPTPAHRDADLLQAADAVVRLAGEARL
ncbi:8-amino-7-oxononanoate synthase [Paenibacillus melissococcoides]|uniref:8-amino-7-oxononanoate synthase n=1 Tax=Paenibacillus melissococcoides TaxID=2912268 RepID=A0ABN8UGX0_9BACL|nr:MULTISPECIES: 8-amino-7-oxononanoate synthase [Paenibacillus]GIO78959.1 putative 8-amino-7-oxononanoate synthase [Paenibacillus dendritiformis]CAH8249084.1 8-amino-7-oxononanoate synthase [Paenibacillus melissococcoides]